MASAAIRIDPRVTDAYVNRAWAYNEKGLYDKALEDCERALELDTKQTAAINNRAVAFARTGHQNKANADYRLACEMGLKVACDNFKDAVGWYPADEARVQLERSRDAFAARDYATVITLSDRVIELEPANAEAFSNRCGANINLGNYASARKDCETAIGIDPNFSMAYNNLGVIFQREGNETEARINFEISCGLKNRLACENLKSK